MGWYSTGADAEEALKREMERQAEARENSGKKARFWLPVGAEKKITFIDDVKSSYGYKLPFTFYEHALERGGSWRNYYTCIDEEEDANGKVQHCPLCASGNRASFVAAYSIIDHSVWEDKKGNERKDEIRLFICKSEVQTILLKAAKKKDGLRGWLVEVSRITLKSPNTGNQFDFEKRTDLSDDLQPPNYMELFAPMSEAELKVIASGVNADDGKIRF